MSISWIPGSLTKVLEHADKMYTLITDSNPDGKLFRQEGEERTEQDKRISAAMWHAHEVHKYLNAAIGALKREVKDA